MTARPAWRGIAVNGSNRKDRLLSIHGGHVQNRRLRNGKQRYCIILIEECKARWHGNSRLSGYVHSRLSGNWQAAWTCNNQWRNKQTGTTKVVWWVDQRYQAAGIMLKPFVLPSPLYHEPLHQICPLEPESASTQAANANHIISLHVLLGIGEEETKV